MHPSPPYSLAVPPLFARLQPARSVLLAGAGGGFDIFAGLPLALALARAGKTVHFANLTFTYLGGTTAEILAPALVRVTPETEGEHRYFPERALASWLRSEGLNAEVFAFEKVGVRPLRAAYQHLVARLRPDALVLVDGGTDLLMSGDEFGLGTPHEDMTSLTAVAPLPLQVKLAVCLGFGIDAFHGVCHAHFLENVAALDRLGAYLGALSIPRDSAEGQGFLRAVELANLTMRDRSSIVNNSIASALKGDFGNVHALGRTQGSELFINPLMSVYFAFELEPLAAQLKYRAELEGTDTIFEVGRVIETYRHLNAKRPYRALPH